MPTFCFCYFNFNSKKMEKNRKYCTVFNDFILLSFSLFVHNFHWDVATRRPAWLVLRACKFALCHFLIPSPASTATSFYFHVINHTSVHFPVLCGDLLFLNDVNSLFCISHFKECSMILSIPNQRFPI